LYLYTLLIMTIEFSIILFFWQRMIWTGLSELLGWKQSLTFTPWTIVSSIDL